MFSWSCTQGRVEKRNKFQSFFRRNKLNVICFGAKTRKVFVPFDIYSGYYESILLHALIIPLFFSSRWFRVHVRTFVKLYHQFTIASKNWLSCSTSAAAAPIMRKKYRRTHILRGVMQGSTIDDRVHPSSMVLRPALSLSPNAKMRVLGPARAQGECKFRQRYRWSITRLLRKDDRIGGKKWELKRQIDRKERKKRECYS